MAERPLLALPKPTKIPPPPGRRMVESVPGITAGRQAQRLGPKFDRLKQVLPDPARLADMRDDPSSIVPERALVFEVTGTLTDFYRALGSIPGLELLGEEEGELVADGDFAIVDKGIRKTEKPVPARLYFTIPDTEALRELVQQYFSVFRLSPRPSELHAPKVSSKLRREIDRQQLDKRDHPAGLQWTPESL